MERLVSESIFLDILLLMSCTSCYIPFPERFCGRPGSGWRAMVLSVMQWCCPWIHTELRALYRSPMRPWQTRAPFRIKLVGALPTRGPAVALHSPASTPLPVPSPPLLQARLRLAILTRLRLSIPAHLRPVCRPA
jgi:hypothetical protein